VHSDPCFGISEVAPGQKVTVQDLLNNGYLGEKKWSFQ